MVEIPLNNAIPSVRNDAVSKASEHAKTHAARQAAGTALNRDAILTDPNSLAGKVNGQTFPIVTRELFQHMRSLLESLNEQTSDLPEAVRMAVEKLAEHFTGMADSQETEVLTEKIRFFIENSGALFEKKIADLIMKLLREGKEIDPKQLAQQPEIKTLVAKDIKPQVLSLYRQLQQQALSELENKLNLNKLLPTMTRLVKHMEQLPPPTQMDRENPIQYVLTTYMPVADQEQPVQFKVYYGKRDKKQEDSFHLCILLNLSALGDLRSDFLLRQRQLQITVFTRDESVRSLITENLESVKTALAPFYEIVDAKAQVSEQKINDFESEDFYVEKENWIDIKV